MKIVLILKDNINCRAPILSVVRHLIELGHELTLVVTGIEEETRRVFEARKCKCVTIGLDTALSSVPKIGKIAKWFSFRRQVFQILSKESYDVLWIASADAALALGKKLLQYPYIFQVQELYDAVPYYRKNLGDYMRHAVHVIVPEEVRAHIFRAWYGLKETPSVLPNKPYGHPRERNLPITDPAAAEAFGKIPKDAKILFYQGWIDKDRDVSWIVDAVRTFNGKVVLAVQGKVLDQEYYQKLRASNCCFFIPFVPAPKHLELTSHMDIGLLTYEHIHQNNEFCAPNKIWEYTGFGLPVLTNDVYSLKHTVAQYDIGFALNLENASKEQIREKIQVLLDHADEYSKKAAVFFDSLNNREIIQKVLTEVAGARQQNR